uniref:Uncharacterized protein n=1 Tax=Rhizophora mucronata TaxID=61149 RepID=A0A2P2NNY7_RHIMU
MVLFYWIADVASRFFLLVLAPRRNGKLENWKLAITKVADSGVNVILIAGKQKRY